MIITNNFEKYRILPNNKKKNTKIAQCHPQYTPTKTNKDYRMRRFPRQSQRLNDQQNTRNLKNARLEKNNLKFVQYVCINTPQSCQNPNKS